MIMCHFYGVVYRNLRRNLREKEEMEDIIKMGLKDVCSVCIFVQDDLSHITGVEIPVSASRESLIVLLL
jgi:hypothetical protein